LTFSDILADVYADLGYQSSPASAEVARIKRYVNQGMRAVLGEPGMGRLLDSDSPLTVASVASQARYVVPEAVALIHGISERTNDRRLMAMDLKTYRIHEPDPASATGTPTHYVPIGRVAVAVQPSNASEIFVDSTAAGDTGTAYLEVITTGGYRRLLSVTMTGATAVTFSASVTDIIQIEDFYISAAAVGTVTLHEDASGGTELARITIGQKRPRYTGFYLWPTPSAAVDYLVDYRREVSELVNDADEPPFPTDYHDMLSAYARMRHYEKQDDGRYQVAKAQFDKRLSQLKYATQTGPDELPVMGGRWIGHSRLGGWFPADTWTRG
jgi:hypothetical protein